MNDYILLRSSAAVINTSKTSRYTIKSRYVFRNIALLNTNSREGSSTRRGGPVSDYTDYNQ